MFSKSTDRYRIPDGAPAWVDRELIASTIETWQPQYDEPLTEEDALEILLGLARLMDGWRWS